MSNVKTAIVPIIYVQLLFMSLNHTEVSFIYRYYYILLSLIIILKCIQADIARKRVTDVVQSYVIIYPCLCTPSYSVSTWRWSERLKYVVPLYCNKLTDNTESISYLLVNKQLALDGTYHIVVYTQRMPNMWVKIHPTFYCKFFSAAIMCCILLFLVFLYKFVWFSDYSGLSIVIVSWFQELLLYGLFCCQYLYLGQVTVNTLCKWMLFKKLSFLMWVW
jgi:hypothetical protein